MKAVLCAVAVLAAVPALAGDEGPPDVRKLEMKGVKLVQPKDPGGPPKAVEITSADELAKSAIFADDAGRDEIKKQVNFDKEKLVVFAWSGSGRDELTGALVKRGGTARFTYARGETDDLRRHRLVFAVPRHAVVEVMK
jgi:hypothetical protein